MTTANIKSYYTVYSNHDNSEYKSYYTVYSNHDNSEYK